MMGSRSSFRKRPSQSKLPTYTTPSHDPSSPVPYPTRVGQEQGKGGPSGSCNRPQHVSYPPGVTDMNEEIDIDIVQHSAQAPTIPHPSSGNARQEQGAEEVLGVDEQPQDVLSGSIAKNGEIIISAIRATDVALGLRRLPAGFYIVLHHNGLEWRTENKPSSVNNNVVEWSGPIPISSDLSAIVRLEVYASFEFEPTLGDGEHLRRLTATVEHLLDRSGRDAPFTFFPKEGDIVSPCSSISVTVRRWKCEGNDPSGSGVVGPYWSTPEPRGEIEDATNQGHSVLTRYRKHGEERDLEHSIQQFECALDVCPRDDPRRAAVKSNLAMAKLILSQVVGTDAPLEAALWLYRDAMVTRPVGHPDRPLTLIQLALVHSARFQRARNLVDEENAEGLLQEAIELSTTDSYEKQAAVVMFRLFTGHREGRIESDGQFSTERDSTPSLADENPWDLSIWLLERFERLGDLADLQRAITIMEGLVRSTSIWDIDHSAVLGNLGGALSYRFERLGELRDLEDAISRKREVIDITPHGHPDKPMRLTNLGNSLQARFLHFGELSNLEDAISAHKEAVHLSPHGHPHKPGFLNNLGASLQTRFLHLGEPCDLKDAISALKEAAHLSPDGHPDKPRYLNNLGTSFLTCFKHFGELNDLEVAISTMQHAVHLCPYGHPDKPMYLTNHGNSLQARFLHLGELSNLEDAISAQREAAHLSPCDHPRKPGYLNNLGTSLQIRFSCLGELSDLEGAISTQREAVHFTPHGHPEKPAYLSNLGNSLQTRFERYGELRDLEDAISRRSEAVRLSPHGHPDKPGFFTNLGSSFQARFERLGELRDLEDAIAATREAVDLSPHGHPHKPLCLNNLGASFLTRFKRLAELSDLEDAISTQKEAVHLSPHGHPDKPGYLNNLGASFHTRFERLGELSDIEDAISAQKEAVHLSPHGHPDIPLYLNNLGASFHTRFERLGELSDLEGAISAMREAVSLSPHGHPNMPARLNNLGASFLTHFKRLGEPSDLEDAISTLREAVHLSPHGHPDEPMYLNNLGTSLQTRFLRLGELRDLEDAIPTQREAVDLSPQDHPDKPMRLTNLGNSFLIRFEHLGRLGDLEDAISAMREAVCLIPRDHPYKLAIMNNLAKSFATRFFRLGQIHDIENALSLSSHVATIPIGPPSVRFSAAQLWIQFARLIHHSSLLHAYSVAVGLIPKLAWIGFSLSHRFDELIQSADVVREAAAAALVAGFPGTALEWLEQGRSVVWGELFQLRRSYEELSSAHPDYASRLHALSTQLDQASVAHEQSLSSLSEKSQNSAHRPRESLQRVADKHRALAIERDKLLQKIRRLPGFERFLLHKPFSHLRAAAHSGPVVVLNAAETRCDALIVLAGVDRVIHVPLPNFSLERCNSVQNTMKHFVRHARDGKPAPLGINWDHVLSPLWKCVVKPVLDALAFSVAPTELSRIFWCPTGPLAFLPIHAAGFHNRQYSEHGHKVFDFVVSSYVPSLATLIPSLGAPAVPSGDLRLLAVRQPVSDDQQPLPGVATELNYIRDVIERFPSAQTTLVESSIGTVEEVLQLMKSSDWVHFACHGIQAGVNSGLCLADGRRLKLRDIVAVSRPHGGLAFLSACQTAMGEKQLSDEAIHIAAGMLFAGYGGVIGSMWSISDFVAPRVARDVYTQLLKKGARPDYREAARALQETTGRLRNQGVSFDEWIPFIHVGL